MVEPMALFLKYGINLLSTRIFNAFYLVIIRNILGSDF